MSKKRDTQLFIKDIDVSIIWDVVINKLPHLKSIVDRILKNMRSK